MLAKHLIKSSLGVSGSRDPDLVFIIEPATMPEWKGMEFGMGMTIAQNETIYIDWGDGSTIEEYTEIDYTGSVITFVHTYTTMDPCIVRVSGVPTSIEQCHIGWTFSEGVTKIVEWGHFLYERLTCQSFPLLTKVPNWLPPSVRRVDGMFQLCETFNDPSIISWNTSGVTSTASMFEGAEAFNQPLSNWDVSSVVDMESMFYWATSFNQPLNNWDVSNVVNMSSMFYGATSFNQPLNNWDVSNVVNMSSMFYEATSFNQPLNNWNVSNVVNMSEMFLDAISFDQDLSSWCVGNIDIKPMDFDTNSALSSSSLPVWGTCPNFEVISTPTLVGVTTASGQSVAVPSGVQEGDLIILIASRSISNISAGVTTGFTNLSNYAGNRTNISIRYKTATAAEPNNYTAAGANHMMLIVLRGDFQNLDKFSWGIGSLIKYSTGLSNNVVYSRDARWLDLGIKVAFAIHRDGSTSLETPPAGFTLRGNTIGTGEAATFSSDLIYSGVFNGETISVGGNSNGWGTVVMTIPPKVVPSP